MRAAKPTPESPISTARPSLCAAPGSAVNRTLDALVHGQWTSAGWLAGVVWEKQRGPVGKRAGQWQRMGALLHKMHRVGAVEKMTTQYHQNLWRIKPNTERSRGANDTKL